MLLLRESQRHQSPTGSLTPCLQNLLGLHLGAPASQQTLCVALCFTVDGHSVCYNAEPVSEAAVCRASGTECVTILNPTALP